MHVWPKKIIRFITKSDGIITNCESLVYYKVRWTVITNGDSFFITKFDGFITNCDRFYKVRWLLQIATVQCVIDFYRLIDTIDISQIRLPIFIDLSIHKSIAIFIDWLLRALYGPVTVIRWMVSRFLLSECFTSGITTPFNQSCCIKLYFIYTWLKKLSAKKNKPGWTMRHTWLIINTQTLKSFFSFYFRFILHWCTLSFTLRLILLLYSWPQNVCAYDVYIFWAYPMYVCKLNSFREKKCALVLLIKLFLNLV